MREKRGRSPFPAPASRKIAEEEEHMTALRPWLAAGVVTICLSGNAAAATFYVSPTGNDAGSGSSSSPATHNYQLKTGSPAIDAA
jgi:hypothetical protein